MGGQRRDPGKRGISDSHFKIIFEFCAWWWNIGTL